MPMWVTIPSRSATVIQSPTLTIFPSSIPEKKRVSVSFNATPTIAAATVGKLNLLSVAFAVLFIGLAVDFGIQFAVRYRDERYHHGDLGEALRRTARGIGLALLLAAGATAVDFYSFLPTDYRGISELGLVAGTSMVFGILLTLTLTPALLALLRPPGEPEPVGYAWAAPLDRALLERRRLVLGLFGLVALACFAASWWLRFDYSPLSLKDPDSESMATLSDIMSDPLASPFTIDVLAPGAEAAAAEAARLAALPDVGRVLTLDSFVPREQEAKLAILDDARFFLDAALAPPPLAPPAPAEEQAALARAAAAHDVVLTSGGASLGEEDHLVAAIAALGTRHLWQLAIKPGRPMSFGQVGRAVVIGLPGNPVAVFVCFLMYVWPLLRRLGGAP